MGTSAVRIVLVTTAALVASSSAFGDVSPDCSPDQIPELRLCAVDRIEDAQVADQLLAPAVARRGWSRACYDLMYAKADGGPETLLVEIHGPNGGRSPSCRTPAVDALSTDEIRQLQKRGGSFDDAVKATVTKTHRKAKAQAASSAQLRLIAEDLAKSLRSATLGDRNRLLRHLGKITVVNGYGGWAEIAMR